MYIEVCSFLGKNGLELFVKLCLLGIVGAGNGSCKGLIVLCARKVDKVVARVACEAFKHGARCHHSCVNTYDGGLIVASEIGLTQPCFPVNKLDVHRNTDRLKLLRNDLSRINMGLIVGGNGAVKGKAVGIARVS